MGANVVTVDRFDGVVEEVIEDENVRVAIVLLAEDEDVIRIHGLGGLDADRIVGTGIEDLIIHGNDRGLPLEVVTVDRLVVEIDLDALQLTVERVLVGRRDVALLGTSQSQGKHRHARAHLPDERLIRGQRDLEVDLQLAGNAATADRAIQNGVTELRKVVAAVRVRIHIKATQLDELPGRIAELDFRIDERRSGVHTRIKDQLREDEDSR